MEFVKYLMKVLSGVLATAFLLLFVLGLLIGVWLPDVIFAPHKTLAKTTLTNGQSFEVIQYWNRCDFYSTELYIRTPTGSDRMVILDVDDMKHWSVPLQVDATNRTITVTLGERIKMINY